MKPGVLGSVMHGSGTGGHRVICLRNWGPMLWAALVTVIGNGAPAMTNSANAWLAPT